MDEVILLNKPLGSTPLQAIERLQSTRPELTAVRLGYAGRLDPMADGLLLVLAGDANTRQEELSKLDKTYQVELLLGLTTDSYDLLGMPEVRSQNPEINLARIQEVLARLVGEIDQAYPPYSAVRVQGHPLFWWTRQGRIDEVVIPTKQRTIYAVELLSRRTIMSEVLLEIVQQRIRLVEGDFRQELIMRSWGSLLTSPKILKFPRLLIEVNCSSGTYMRSLVDQIGRDLGTTAVASRITRTQAGDYSLTEAISLD